MRSEVLVSLASKISEMTEKRHHFLLAQTRVHKVFDFIFASIKHKKNGAGERSTEHVFPLALCRRVITDSQVNVLH